MQRLLLVVNAKLKQNQQGFTGADDVSNFIVKVNATTVTPTAVTEVDGKYTFTISALSNNDVVTIQLYDTAESRAVIALDNDLYKSNVATTITIGA